MCNPTINMRDVGSIWFSVLCVSDCDDDGGGDDDGDDDDDCDVDCCSNSKAKDSSVARMTHPFWVHTKHRVDDRRSHCVLSTKYRPTDDPMVQMSNPVTIPYEETRMTFS